MQKDGFDNVSGRLSERELGLGWLTGVTAWTTDHAVAMTPHRHAHIELIFCLRGELVYEVGKGKQIMLGEGAGVVMPAHTLHVLRGGTDAPCRRLGFHVAARMPGKCPFALFTSKEFATFHAKLREFSLHPFRLDPPLANAVKELEGRMRHKPRDVAELGFIRTLACLILFRTIHILAQPIAAPMPQLMDQAVTFLEEHCAKPIGIDALVRYMGYGRTALYQLFKQHTGLSPNEYLVRYRIRKAEELIKRPHMTIAAVSKAVGFSSVSYFRNVFLKYTGNKPESCLK